MQHGCCGDAMRPAGALHGAVTSFRGELYGGFMSAPRRGQVVKSFLDAEDEGSVSTKRKLERRHVTT